MDSPSYVIIGHVTRDVTPGGWQPGGTAIYAALAARRLGEQVAVVTSAVEDYPFEEVLPGIPVANCPAPFTTFFHNVVTGRGRRQFLLGRASDIPVEAVPARWREACLVHLAPVANELPPEMTDIFPKALLGVTAQGWLRRWDTDGRIRPREWPDAEKVLSRANATIVSAEDFGGDEQTIARFARAARLLIVTRGAAGCRLYYNSTAQDVAAYPAVAQGDGTGAGDVFAAAFLIALGRGDDPFRAARFAGCAASFVVERSGLPGIPGAEDISRRLVEDW